MRKSILLGFAIAFLGLAGMEAKADDFDFAKLENNIFEATLDNGLKLIIAPNHDAPVVAMTTWCNVGSSDDPKGYSGMAHMFEHMAFKGTTIIGTKDYAKEVVAIAKEDALNKMIIAERSKGLLADNAKIEKLEKQLNNAIEESYALVIPNEFPTRLLNEGAVGLNAFTSSDQTAYIMNLPSNKLELWVAMEAERFLNPVLREMYKERSVIQEERRMRTENSPSGRMHEEFLATAYKAHPYGTPTVGHMSDIQNYTREVAAEFFKKYYSPSNMSIVLVGDVDPKEGLAMVKKYWERIPRHEVPNRITTVEPKQNVERRLTIEDKTQPNMMIGWHVPEINHPDMPAVQAMMSVIGEGRTSRLYKRMVRDEQIAVGAGAWAGYPGVKYPTLAVIYAYPAQNKTNADCEKVIYEEIEKLQNELVSNDELEKVKARTSVAFIRNLRDNLEFAMSLARYQQYYGNWREVFREIDRINSVKPEDVKRVANEYFVKTNRTVACIETIVEEENKGEAK